LLGWIERFLFAPEGGGWAYTYAQRPDLISLLSVVGVVPLLLLLWRHTESQIETRPLRVLAQWLAAALVVQWLFLSIAPFPLTAKLESVSANGFYTVSKQYPAADFLRHFNSIAGTLPMHVQANLPGKVLLFHLLRTVSEAPAFLAAALIVLSTLGGLLVYLAAWQWCDDRRIAVVAAIFYLLFPARMFFLPLLNTVSPLFMLVPLVLAGGWARTGVSAYAIALGPSLYALAIFDPLPLAGGLCGLAAFSQQLKRPVAIGRLATFAAIVVAGWLVTHAIVAGAFGFNLVSAYRFAIDNATTFNLEQQRPYWFWVGHNLKDFAIAIGIAQTLVVAFGVRRWLLGPTAVIGAAIVAGVLIVDALGVNRGEVQRLWIFQGVLCQILAARSCGHDRRITGAVIGLSAAQTALCMRSIAWVVP
jgi:hypothetical protein